MLKLLSKYHSSLPVIRIRWQHWATPLTFLGALLFILPIVLTNLFELNIEGANVFWVIMPAFLGLFLWAYDVKWTDYRVKMYGVQNSSTSGWTKLNKKPKIK